MANRSLGTLTVDLVAKVGGFRTGMDQAARETERSMKRIESATSTVKKTVAGVFAGLAVRDLVGAIIRNTTEAEDAVRQLEARLASTGGVSGHTSQGLQSLAKELAGLTTFGGSAIVQMEALLLSFTNIRGQQVVGATRAVLDLATALGTDLNSAAMTVGRALNDPVKGLSALGRAGVQFSDEQERIIKRLVATGDIAGAQAVILGQLETAYGGAAQAAAGTFGGALTQLQNALGDLLEADGGGLNEATEGLQELTALLRDPDTIQAAQHLTGAIIGGFKAAAEAITGTVGVMRFVGEEIAAFVHGPTADDIVRMQDQVEELEAMLNSNPLTDSKWLDRGRVFSDDGLITWWSDEELKKKIKELRERIDTAMKEGGRANLPLPKTSTTTGGTGGTTEYIPSEAFEKQSAALERQIALFGQLTEEAQISYAIQSGALKDLQAGEAERLINLARWLDSMREGARIAKETAEELAAYEKAMAQQAKAFAEAFDPGLDVEALTGEVDALMARFDRGAEITSAVRTEQERYNDTLAELDGLLSEGVISVETYGRALAEAKKELNEAGDEWTVFKDQAARNTQDILARSLRDGFDEGARGVLDAFGDMLRDMAAQAVAADIAGAIFGNADGSSGGEGWRKLLDGILGMFTGMSSTGTTGGGGSMPANWSGPRMANGGDIVAGRAVMVGERGPEIIVPRGSGTVIPNHQLGKGMTVNQRFSVTSERGDRISRRTEQQVAAAAARGLAMASRRAG